MSTPSTQIIAIWIQEALDDEGWLPLRDIAVRVLELKWKRSLSEIEDYLEDKLEYVAEQLRNELADRLIDGKVQDFEIDDEAPPYLRRTLPISTSLLTKLRAIDPFEFEVVCSKILAKLGATAEVTQRTNDGGIDFIGTSLKIVHTTLPMPASCSAIVIGQAKRYKEGSAISETKLREFVGAAVLQRHRLSSRSAISPLMPTLFAFWTTSDLEPNAKKFARSVGLWYMDGVTLAAYARELGLTDEISSLPEHRNSQTEPT